MNKYTSNRTSTLYKKYKNTAQRLKSSLLEGCLASKTQQVKRLRRYEKQLQRLGIAASLSFTLLGFSPELAAQISTVGEEFRVNSFTTGVQLFPSVAVDSDGDFIIAWAGDGQNSDSYDIYAQRYSNDGTPLGNEFQVNSFTTGRQQSASLAVDNDGNFVIAWSSSGQDGDNTSIYAQRYDSSGSPLGNEFRVNSFTTGNQSSPSIGMDNDGDFVIAWGSYEQDGNDFGIFAQRYNSDGAPLGGEFQVNSFTIGRQNIPSVAVDSDGDFVITWSSDGQDGDDFGVYAQRYDHDGMPTGSEFQANSFTTDSQASPSVAMDDDGNFVIAWNSREQDGDDFGIYAQQYDSDGTPVGSEFQVNSFTTNYQALPSAAMDNDGNFVIAWEDYGQDGDAFGIYAQRYNSDGMPTGSEFQANSFTTDYQFAANVAMDNDGDFIIAWQSFEQDGDDYGVYAQRYEFVEGIVNINTLILNTCTRPFSASFDPVPDAIGYQVQITVLARNGEIITRRIDDNEISGNFNIPRRLLGTDVEIQIAAIFLDEGTGEEVVGAFSESGTFTLGCDEADNLILESRSTAFNTIQFTPNPVQDQLQVQLQSDVASYAKVKVLNLDGRILLEQNHQLFTGQNELYFNVEQLLAGQYFLQIQTAEGIEYKKFVKH